MDRDCSLAEEGSELGLDSGLLLGTSQLAVTEPLATLGVGPDIGVDLGALGRASLKVAGNVNLSAKLVNQDQELVRSSFREQEKTNFTIGKYSFDYQKRILTLGEDSQRLTSKENDLLRLLCLNEGKVLERTYALKAIWEDDNYFNARSMDVYIAKLRKHLKQDDTIEIMNVHGRGFRFMIHK